MHIINIHHFSSNLNNMASSVSLSLHEGFIEILDLIPWSLGEAAASIIRVLFWKIRHASDHVSPIAFSSAAPVFRYA